MLSSTSETQETSLKLHRMGGKKSSRWSTRLHEDGSEEDGKREAQGEDVGEGVKEGVNEKKGVLLLGDALCQASCIMLLTLSLGRAG